MVKAYIDGQEGTTGLRIHERLSARDDIELIEIDPALRKDAAERKKLLNAADVCFLCLPDAAAKEAAAMMDNEHTILIDASTAHRTDADWAYGLPELSPAHRAKIASGKRIAVPGCHASGFIALVYPLIEAGLIPAEYPHAVHSLTGYSGGGKGMIAEYQGADRSVDLDSPRQYALTQQHKHLREMIAISGAKVAPIFMPIVADFYSGMEVTVPVHLTGEVTKAAVHAALKAHYQGSKLVSVMDLGAEPSFMAANALSGLDTMQITVSGNDERLILIARFDNLGKGSSGAAVQCLNIALGLDETTGLAI